MELLELSAREAEDCLTLFAGLKTTSRNLLNLLTTLVIRTRLGVCSLVDCIKPMLVLTSVALVSDRIKDIYTFEAPFDSALAVNIDTARF
jgi:hypothetical protein